MVRGNCVADFHAGVWNKNPKVFFQEGVGALLNIYQISGYEQESRHVECIDNLFGIGIFVSYVNKVKGNHQYDEYTFQIINFLDAVFHVDSSLNWKRESLFFPPSFLT